MAWGGSRPPPVDKHIPGYYPLRAPVLFPIPFIHSAFLSDCSGQKA